MRYCITYYAASVNALVDNIVGWTYTAEEAKRLASEHAYDVPDGTCIVDLSSGTIDYGDRVEALSPSILLLFRALAPTSPSMMLGCDPECELLDEYGNLVYASRATRDWRTGVSIGPDGSGGPIEFRPDPGETPQQLLDNLARVIRLAGRTARRHGLYLSAAGHQVPCGFHIHISWPSNTYQLKEALIERIDRQIGDEVISVSGRARGYYRKRAAWRSQTYPGGWSGVEYRTPGAAWLFCPDSARTLFDACLDALDGELDTAVRSRLYAWSDWLVDAVEKVPFVPVLWGRTWRSEVRTFAREFGLNDPPVKDMNLAKQIRRYQGLIQYIKDTTSPRPAYIEFSGCWSLSAQRIFRTVLEGSCFTRIGRIRLWGLPPGRGLVWSVPEETYTLSDGRSITPDPLIRISPNVENGLMCIGLPGCLTEQYENPALQELADAVLSLVLRADSR